MNEFRAALQNLYDAINDPDVDYYNTLPLQVAIESAKALIARPEPARITFNEKGEAFIPGLSEEDEAIVNAALKRRAVDDRIKRPESEPRITREEAMELLHKYFLVRITLASKPSERLYTEADYEAALEACLAAMGVSESPPAASDGEK